MDREDDSFDTDDDSYSAGDINDDFEPVSSRPGRRKRSGRKETVQKERAAWSKLEDVLAEKRLRKQLQDNFDEFDWN